MVQVIICKYQGQELFGQPVGTLEKQIRILEKNCHFYVIYQFPKHVLPNH